MLNKQNTAIQSFCRSPVSVIELIHELVFRISTQRKSLLHLYKFLSNEIS
jgi:hypothetical protein